MMNFLVLLIFACSNGSQIYIGYLLVSIEIFVCCNFSQMSRLMSMGKELQSLDIDKPKILEKQNINTDENKNNESKDEKRKEDKDNHTVDKHNKNNNFKSNQNNSTKQDNQNKSKEFKLNNN